MIKRLVFIGFKYPHHGQHSGYDQIAKYLAYDLVLHADKIPIFRGLHALGQDARPLMLGRYTLLDPLKFFYKAFRIFAFLRCLFMRNTCFHFCYPETGVLFTRNLFTSTNRFVATVHLTAESMKFLPMQVFQKMKRLDHLIGLSEEKMHVFGLIPYSYIPHGIETDFFRPQPNLSKDIDILMLGNWMRDFGRAAGIFKLLQQGDQVYHIKVVALPENLHVLRGLPQVECLSEISDLELLSLLQRSRVLFLPLTGLTASNALLEAAACGCRICLSLPEGIGPSYFPDYIQMIHQDVEKAVKELAEILQNDWNGEAIAEHTHRYYGWEKIANRVRTLLLSRE